MTAFYPIAASPIPASPAGTGTVYAPGTVTFTFEAQAAPTVEGINPLKVQQIVRETLRSSGTGATEIVIRSAVRETLRSATLAAASTRRRMSLM
jgi:hypothetical protein